MANNNPIKVDLDRFENEVRAIREVSRGIIDDDVVCPEPSPFIADNPIVQEYCAFHQEIIDLLKTFKYENELFTDRLFEIGENYRAMNDNATQRISADKVEHVDMLLSSKQQAKVQLNTPTSNAPTEATTTLSEQSMCSCLLVAYMTDDPEINKEIENLFAEYGNDLSGLLGVPFSDWEKFSESRKNAIARIYYTDINLLTTTWPADTDRLNAILSFMQNSKREGDFAFDIGRLEELESYIPSDDSDAQNVIKQMKGMTLNLMAGFDGCNHISVKQMEDGIHFFIYDGLSESGEDLKSNAEIGIYKIKQYNYLYKDYLTEDADVNKAIKKLFDDFGPNLDGLVDKALEQRTFQNNGSFWENLNIEEKLAISRVFYIDMNRAIDNGSNDNRRLESILTLFSNGGNPTGMAFDIEALNDLENLIFNDGTVFSDVVNKLNYDRDDSTWDLIERMKTMPINITLPDGRVRINQTDSGVIFSLVDETNVFEMGRYFDRDRSIKYLKELEKDNPGSFNHFENITGLDMDAAATYICNCVNSYDLNLMKAILTTDGKYDAIRTFTWPSYISSGCAYKFTEYTTILLRQSIDNPDLAYKQEYINLINAVLDNQLNKDNYEKDLDTLNDVKSLFEMITVYSYIDADIKTGAAWMLAETQVQNDLGYLKGGIKSLTDDEIAEIEGVLAVSNLNATVWADLRACYEEFDINSSNGCRYFNVGLIEDSWDINCITLSTSLKAEEINCVCNDYNEAKSTDRIDNYSKNYKAMIKEKEKMPWKIVKDASIAVLGVYSVQGSVGLGFLLAVAEKNEKDATGYTGKFLANRASSKALKGAIGASSAIANDGIDFYKLEEKLNEQNKPFAIQFMYDMGVSKTGNGNRVIEYSNMYELLSIKYKGINEHYDLGLDGQSVINTKNSIKSKSTGGAKKNKQRFSDSEIDNALLLIWYGDEAARNKVIIDDSNPKNTVKWHENVEFKSVFEIPPELIDYCLSNSRVGSDVIIMFNENVGNLNGGT